ncbi:MAG: ATP-binding protein [Candidatus Omnitrophota bacterium]
MRNKIIFIFGILSLIFLVILVSTNIIFHFRHTLALEKEKAWGLSKILAKSLDLPMVAGEMDTVAEILLAVGELKDLKRVHITDAVGVIRYSSDPRFVNIPSQSEIVKRAINEKKNIGDFEQRGNDYLFSLALPLLNEERCYSCHSAEHDVLGVLRVGIDWDPVQNDLMNIVQKDVIISAIFYLLILFLSILFQRFYNAAQLAYKNLEEAQGQLIKAEKMAAIGQMAAAISHDLRNPLTGIKMATYYLSSKIDKNKIELVTILKDIELEIDYASNVVTNILTYSKPTELICTYADINKVIKETMPFLHLPSRDSDIVLVTKYASNIPEMLMDVKQMKQVIVNLLTNAVQAMPKGGKLTISTSIVGEFVEMMVNDTGVGISSDDREKIFNPFFTTKARGVGLGLSIVFNIVNRHEGAVDVYTDRGRGTTFIVKLPMRQRSQD